MILRNFEKAAESRQLPCVPQENAFHALRLACCLTVLYEHAVMLSGMRLPCLNLRAPAVNVFFILSGFWVTLSFLKSGSVREYALRRMRRIFPCYLLVVTGCAVLLVSFSSLGARAYFSSAGFWKYLAANLCTLNFLHPSLPGVFEGAAVNGSLWTVKIEAAFYVVLPILTFAVKKFRGGGQDCASLRVHVFGFVRGVYASCN